MHKITMTWQLGAAAWVFLNVSLCYSAVTFTKVSQLIAPVHPGDAYQLLSSSDGRIYQISPFQTDLVRRVMAFEASERSFKIVASRDWVTRLEAAPGSAVTQSEPRPQASEIDDQELTRFKNAEEAESAFKGLRHYFPRGSACTSRADFWTTQLLEKHGVRSQKVFLFFTQRYIKNHSFAWWFHVAPLELIGDKEVVFDRSFADHVLTLREWTDTFIEEKTECPVVQKYQEAMSDTEGVNCYLIKTPMSVFEPKDIKERETAERSRSR